MGTTIVSSKTESTVGGEFTNGDTGNGATQAGTQSTGSVAATMKLPEADTQSVEKYIDGSSTEEETDSKIAPSVNPGCGVKKTQGHGSGDKTTNVRRDILAETKSGGMLPIESNPTENEDTAFKPPVQFETATVGSQHGGSQGYMPLENNVPQLHLSADEITSMILMWVSRLDTLNHVEDMICCIQAEIIMDAEEQKTTNKQPACTEKMTTLADIERIQVIFNSLNEDLQNTFDNYVCFLGTRDDAQMHRLFESACKRAEESWSRSSLSSKGFSSGILTKARDKFVHLCRQHNESIVKNEEQICGKVTSQLTDAYTAALNNFMQTEKDHQPPNHIEAIHRRLVSQCISIVRKAMNYGGRLNNVALEATKTMQQAMDLHYQKEISLKAATPPLTHPHKEQSPIEKYQARMHMATDLSPEELKKRHDLVVDKMTRGMKGNEKEKLSLILDTHFLNMLEYQLEVDGNSEGNCTSYQMGLYLTHEWVYVLAYTPSLGTVGIGFPDFEKPRNGFPAMVARHKGEFAWGYAAKKLFSENDGQIDISGLLLEFITNKDDFELAHAMATFWITGAKACTDGSVRRTMNRVLLVIPNALSFSSRSLLRSCCHAAGFKRVTMLTESVICASRICNTFVNDAGDKDILILAVTAGNDGITMEIFGLGDHPGNGSKVQIFAVAAKKWASSDISETVRATYQRAVKQLHKSRRNSVRYYTVIREIAELPCCLDQYFSKEENLAKMAVRPEKFFFDTFSEFGKDPAKLRGVLDGLITLLHNVSAHFKKVRKQYSIQEETTDDKTHVQRKHLLERCGSMEKQINDGDVEVGPLRKRIILEAIKHAREAVSENMAFGVEADAINDLFKSHDFE